MQIKLSPHFYTALRDHYSKYNILTAFYFFFSEGIEEVELYLMLSFAYF